MDSGINIRSAELRDLKELSELYENLMREQMAFDRFARISENADFQKFAISHLESGNSKFFLAEKNGKILGFIRLNIYSGANLERVEAKKTRLVLKKLSPRRILRKILRELLVRIEKSSDAPVMFHQLRAGYIADMFIRKEEREKGIGTILVNHAFNWFKEMKINQVYLQALSENNAGVAFWTRQGFSIFRVYMRREI